MSEGQEAKSDEISDRLTLQTADVDPPNNGLIPCNSSNAVTPLAAPRPLLPPPLARGHRQNALYDTLKMNRVSSPRISDSPSMYQNRKKMHISYMFQQKITRDIAAAKQYICPSPFPAMTYSAPRIVRPRPNQPRFPERDACMASRGTFTMTHRTRVAPSYGSTSPPSPQPPWGFTLDSRSALSEPSSFRLLFLQASLFSCRRRLRAWPGWRIFLWSYAGNSSNLEIAKYTFEGDKLVGQAT